MDKICQSCGMPIRSDDMIGTNADGSRNDEYCIFCFEDGGFTFNGSYDDFVEKQVKIAQEKMGLPANKARETANGVLPNLKRWKN